MKNVEKRQTAIIELISKEQKVDVIKLSEIFGVSQVTIRKDLDQLENQGLIKREHGYATLFSRDDINTRLAYHYDIKKRIASLAASHIHDGETIMIESGSCCALLALEVATHKKDVTIITNSAYIADYIRKTNVKVILLGGEYQKEAQVVVGPMVKNCVSQFFVDKFFIGTDGFSVQTGFTGNDYMRTQTVRDMGEQAKSIIVITESSKFDSVGLVSLLPVSKISKIYTDNLIHENWQQYFKEQQVELHCAKVAL